MLIVCPSCASRYELDGAKLGTEGRKVRCAGCQTLWHVAPEPDLPDVPSPEETQALLNEELQQAAAIESQVSALAAEQMAADHPVAEDLLEASESPAEPERRMKRGGRKTPAKGKDKGRSPRLRAMSAPAALALVGVMLLGSLLWQRERTVRAAPQLAAAFEMLGFPVNVRGLKLSAVESGLVEDGGGRFLVVEGDVTNITRGNTRVPPIEVAVKDAAGQTLYSWKTDPPREDLEPSELMRFRARLAAPPATGQSVQVRFAASGPTSAASNTH